MNISAITPIVKKLLEVYPVLRDNDSRLIANVWHNYIKENLEPELESIDAFDILKYLSKGKLPKTESITRVRRKLQETHIDLRGEKYESRQNIQRKIITEIKNIN